MSNLKSKIAVVTGGNGVLGGAIAKGFAEKGVRVGILGRTEQTVLERVEEIKQLGGDAFPVVANVLDEKILISAKETILQKYGTADILVNAAGGNMKGATITPKQSVFDLDLNDFDNVNQLNLKGTILPTLVFAREMVEQKKGSIINISSMAAQRTLTRVMGYSTAKAAVDNFTKWLAVEMASKYGDGIQG